MVFGCAGADIDKANEAGETPLFLALMQDHWEVRLARGSCVRPPSAKPYTRSPKP